MAIESARGQVYSTVGKSKAYSDRFVKLIINYVAYSSNKDATNTYSSEISVHAVFPLQSSPMDTMSLIVFTISLSYS